MNIPSDNDDEEPKVTTAADVIIDNQAEILAKLNKIIDYNRKILAAVSSKDTEFPNIFDYTPVELTQLPKEKENESRKDLFILSGILAFLLLIVIALAIYFYFRD